MKANDKTPEIDKFMTFDSPPSKNNTSVLKKPKIASYNQVVPEGLFHENFCDEKVDFSPDLVADYKEMLKLSTKDPRLWDFTLDNAILKKSKLLEFSESDDLVIPEKGDIEMFYRLYWIEETDVDVGNIFLPGCI